MLSRDRDVEQQTGALAVLRHQIDARASIASRGEAMSDGSPVEPDRAAERAVDAEDGARQFGAPGADEAREAQDLAAPDRRLNRTAPDRCRSARSTIVEHVLARRRRRRHVERS